MIEQNHPFITCLLHYQAANNAHDVTTAVAAFTENGISEINGHISQGSQALYDAHEYDSGSDTQIKMADFEIEENTLAEGRSFDYKGGRVLYELAHLYAQRDANEAIPGNKSYK
jgi:hypothetical protein